MLVYALGVVGVANSYNNANTLPNAVYDLMLGGILTSVVVPLLVAAAKRDADRGEAYDQRMFTLATMALAVLTVLATLAAPLLVNLYAHALTGPERHLTVIFAFFFIPQIFFYGVSSLAGGVLNARGRFAAPMWTPVINNIVVILVLLLFIATGGIGVHPGNISTAQIQLLGFGTTLGIIAQTAAHDPGAAPGRVPLAPAVRLPPGRGHRDPPDGRPAARLRADHPGLVPGRAERRERGVHASRARASTRSPPTATPGSCSRCRTPSSASR